MTRQISTGLIGYGYGGSVFHAPLIRSAAALSLDYIVTSRRQQVEALPGVRPLNSVPELLAITSLELVVVASPSGTHFDLAQQALRAGKHVVVDKPFVLTVAEAEALMALAERQRRVLSVFQNRRWDGDFLTVQDLIAAGPLGSVYHYEAHFDRFRPHVRPVWREQSGPGSGILYDLGAHLIDQALQLFGMPEAVTADVLAQRPGAHATDYFHLLLHYGAMRAVLHGSMLVAQPGPHFIVHGGCGSFVKYGMDPQEEALKRGEMPGSPEWGADPVEQHGVLVTDGGNRRTVKTRAGAYETYYAMLAESIANAGRVPVTPAGARNGLAILEAALSSAAERRTVEIPESQAAI